MRLRKRKSRLSLISLFLSPSIRQRASSRLPILRSRSRTCCHTVRPLVSSSGSIADSSSCRHHFARSSRLPRVCALVRLFLVSSFLIVRPIAVTLLHKPRARAHGCDSEIRSRIRQSLPLARPPRASPYLPPACHPLVERRQPRSGIGGQAARCRSTCPGTAARRRGE